MRYFYAFLHETPGKELDPNSTAHWGTKAKVIKKARAAFDRHHGNVPKDWPQERTYVTWLIFWEKGRKMLDYDNALGSMKPYQDGLADELGINDSLMESTIEQFRSPNDQGYILCLVRTL